MKSQVRIIGGRWRGRKLAVPDVEGLRPTPDRIRETLFNWLGTACRGAVVLDCFAGSGVLGLEAVSRGASRLIAIERHRAAAASLRRQVERLEASDIEILCGDAPRLIEGLAQTFDIVFIDPPYARAELRGEIVRRLEAHRRLRPGARLVFEWPRGEAFELPSPRLAWQKRQSAGRVDYGMAEWRVSG